MGKSKSTLLTLCLLGATAMSSTAQELYLLSGTPNGIQAAVWQTEKPLDFQPLNDRFTEWMAAVPGGEKLISSGPMPDPAGGPPGEIRLDRIRLKETQLKLDEIGTDSTQGKTAIYCAVSPNAQTAWVTNFRFDTHPSQGSLIEFPLAKDGRLSEATQRLLHPGRGKNSPRQDASHPHAVAVDPQGNWLAIGDLGIDAVVFYKLDNQQRILPESRIILSTGAGSGPRHVTFHPERPLLFFNTEQTNEAGIIDLSGEEPVLAGKWKCSERGGAPADLVIHPRGHLLYVSVRGPEEIVVFDVATEKPALQKVTSFSVEGENPRAIGIHPEGTHLLSANRGSNLITARPLHPETGLPNGEPLHSPLSAAPTSLLFWSPKTP